MPISSSARPSKVYPNLDFWFENKPSGNPGSGGQDPALETFLKVFMVVEIRDI
jgi:hypothetical protein